MGKNREVTSIMDELEEKKIRESSRKEADCAKRFFEELAPHLTRRNGKHDVQNLMSVMLDDSLKQKSFAGTGKELQNALSSY